MNSGRYVISQVMDLVHRQTLDRLSKDHRANYRVRHFGTRQQLTCMVFAQMTARDSLRDIETCLNAKPWALHHLGFRAPVAVSTLAEANAKRPWQLWQELALRLITRARKLYADDDLELGPAQDVLVYALDSTTIDLCLNLFPWAHFRTTKAGINLHTQLDLRGRQELAFMSPENLDPQRDGSRRPQQLDDPVAIEQQLGAIRVAAHRIQRGYRARVFRVGTDPSVVQIDRQSHQPCERVSTTLGDYKVSPISLAEICTTT